MYERRPFFIFITINYTFFVNPRKVKYICTQPSVLGKILTLAPVSSIVSIHLEPLILKSLHTTLTLPVLTNGSFSSYVTFAPVPSVRSSLNYIRLKHY